MTEEEILKTIKQLNKTKSHIETLISVLTKQVNEKSVKSEKKEKTVKSKKKEGNLDTLGKDLVTGLPE